MSEAVTLQAGDLSVDLLPEHGLDLGRASFGGTRFSWESGSSGGLMFTCGLQNVGLPSEGQPQHGRYRSLPARDVEMREAVATGRVVDGPLELTRTITVAAGGVRVSDTVRNTGESVEPAPLLYHVNLLWDTVASDASEVIPRDEDARAGSWREQGPPGPERVYEHLGATEARATVGTTGIRVRASLPRLWQWIEPSLGALGLEPANCSVLGRAHDRAAGRLPTLAPGELRTTTLEIEVERT